MIRTQIYLRDEQHLVLLQIAKSQNTSLSDLIRQGAAIIIQKKIGNSSPQVQALTYLKNYSKRKLPKLSKSSVELVRQERD